MRHKEKVKEIRDHIAPILVQQAHLEMMRMYKPGVMEPIGGSATVEIRLSTKEPLRSVVMVFDGFRRDFYGCYKVLIPLRPLVDVKDATFTDLLQEHVRTRVRAVKGDLKKVSKEGTLVLYWIDFWITKDGEVWHEQDENIWRQVPLGLPEGLMQATILNLRSTLHVKYEV